MSRSRLLSPVQSIDNCDAINLSIVSSESDDIVDDDDIDESSSTSLEETEEADAREETDEMEETEEADPDEDDPDEDDPDERVEPNIREEAGERFMLMLSAPELCGNLGAQPANFGMGGGGELGISVRVDAFSHPNVTR
eukprot:g2144.t1 g2144   contig11:815419-815835(+)